MAGASHFGWWFRILDFPDGPSFTFNYCPKNIPMGTFFNNTVHSSGRFGIWIFPGYHPTVSGSCRDKTPSPARFDTFITYLNEKGAEWVNANNIQFINFISYDNSLSGIETRRISGNSLPNTYYIPSFYDHSVGPLISKCTIIGNSDSTSPYSITESGLLVPWDRGLLIDSVKFYNFPSYGTRAIRSPSICP